MAYNTEANEGEISWVQVAVASGPTEAGLIVEYLRAEGIRAVAWQEAMYLGSKCALFPLCNTLASLSSIPTPLNAFVPCSTAIFSLHISCCTTTLIV